MHSPRKGSRGIQRDFEVVCPPLWHTASWKGRVPAEGTAPWLTVLWTTSTWSGSCNYVCPLCALHHTLGERHSAGDAQRWNGVAQDSPWVSGNRPRGFCPNALEIQITLPGGTCPVYKVDAPVWGPSIRRRNCIQVAICCGAATRLQGAKANTQPDHGPQQFSVTTLLPWA